MTRVILHCDMNNFFASVECRYRPDLRDKCMAVCGDSAQRQGIILAKNEKAKAKGVETGMSIWQAKALCPELELVKPHFERYAFFSERAVEIYSRFTDMVEPFGIDECWLDVTGSLALFGSGERIADMIRLAIRRELGLTVSVGVSFNKVFAKLGSDMKKPDAVTAIYPESFRQQLWGLPASSLLWVGKTTEARLKDIGVNTIGQLAELPREYLRIKLGKQGERLWDYANGIDDSSVSLMGAYEPIKSISHGRTTAEDLVRTAQVWQLILELSTEVCERLRHYKLMACGVQVCIKDPDLKTAQVQCRLPYPTQSTLTFARAAYKVYLEKCNARLPLRAVTVRAISLCGRVHDVQLDFFSEFDRAERTEKLDRVTDRLKEKFGNAAPLNATLLKTLY